MKRKEIWTLLAASERVFRFEFAPRPRQKHKLPQPSQVGQLLLWFLVLIAYHLGTSTIRKI